MVEVMAARAKKKKKTMNFIWLVKEVGRQAEIVQISQSSKADEIIAAYGWRNKPPKKQK